MKSRGRRGVAAVLGLVACSAVVWQSSHAAFTAATDNSGNTLTAGTVSLTDNDGAAALFTAPNLGPGDTATMCIGVQYTGSLATPIKVYFPQSLASETNAGVAQSWADDATAEMDDNMTLHVEVNSADLSANPGFGSAAANCAPTGVGTFSDVVPASATIRSLLNTSTSNAFATTTLPTTTIAQNKWRVFKFTYLLPSGVGNTVQGDGVGFGVKWEVSR